MRFAKLVSLWALAAAPVILATPCTTGTLDSYIALGSTGCMNGIFNVEDFTFTVISTTIPIAANNINVSPMATANNFALQFNSSLFNVSPSDSIKVQIGYSWDPGDIGSISEVMDDPPVKPGVSSINIDACENAFFISGICPTTLATAMLIDDPQNGKRTLNATIIFPPGVTSLGMEDTIFLAGNGCNATVCADITDFRDTVVTPEPATLPLVPAAVGVLFACRRRTRPRAHSGQPFL